MIAWIISKYMPVKRKKCQNIVSYLDFVYMDKGLECEKAY